MSQYPITITGHLTHEPELTKVSENMYKTRLRVASSRRVFNRDRQPGEEEWRDIDLIYTDVEMWGQFAVNAKKSLHRGMPVIVVGSIVSEQWLDKNGGRQNRTFIKAFYLGLDLNRYVVAAKKLAVVYNAENVPDVNLGDAEVVPDIDRTQPVQAVQAASASEGDNSHDTLADRRLAARASRGEPAAGSEGGESVPA